LKRPELSYWASVTAEKIVVHKVGLVTVGKNAGEGKADGE